MKINKIDHICIAVKNLDAARKIWEPMLGKEKPDDESEKQSEEEVSDARKTFFQALKELKENIDDLVEQLRGKKELSWQEKQMLENLVEQKESLEEQIKELQTGRISPMGVIKNKE